MTERRTDAPTASPNIVHAALAVGGFAIGTTEFATMSLLPYFATDLHIDAPTAGHVISAYALGVVVGAPLIAVMAAKMARRTLLIGLMLLFALGNGLSGIAPTYGWMLAFRFLSGLPHGAYFGIASLVAASLVPPGKRSQAVARVMLGLTVATIIGVPVANAIGRAIGWRWCFGLVTALALLTALLVALFAPRDNAPAGNSALAELAALRRLQVWLALGTGAIGFGGLFAVYTYLADTMHAVTHASAGAVPFALAAFGVGATIGSLVVPRFADRALKPTAAGLLIWSAIVLSLWPLAAQHLWSVIVELFAIGLGTALGIVLQTRLMDVADHAQGLAAALNHSAFNTANALGPALGGAAIAAGYGWTSTGWVGAMLAIGGLVIWIVSIVTSRATQR
ncbi:MFS transporter [Sphingomonas nostoxanthinifaciens]|nr:MFS transporter [Sphingomonas nostoxanthinifaciens]UAK26746.1 MFS transporter [Sphingomonas nostoxanthinifaciens]